MNVIYTQSDLVNRAGRSRWAWVKALSDDDIQKAADAEGELKPLAHKANQGRIYHRFSDLERFFPGGNGLADGFIDHLKKHPGSVDITTDAVMILTRGAINDVDAG